GEVLSDDQIQSPAADALPPLKSIGGQELRQLFAASTAWLERHAAYVNSLNVFPVPDGDSGTNMLLTMQAAIKEVGASPEHAAGAMLKAISHGALLGARGNSGVILSQIIRGFARAIEKKDAINADDFAAALVEGARTAYKGVVKPVEGTILTVARESADAATIAATQSDDLRVVWDKTVQAARVSVIKTPMLLPVLREAGVVDAGGQGLLVLLEGALKYLNGESLELAAAGVGAQALEQISREEGWGFDIQFHIRGMDLDVDAIREKIASMGESALIVGDATLIKVHVHAPMPGAILDYGCSVGVITNVIVENMQEQYIDFMAGQTARPPITAEDIAGMTTVAVVPGAGLVRVYESLGVGRIISGGQTMNPSIQDILQAIDAVKTEQVIVLPNNKNIIPAAEQAKLLAKKQVALIPTKTIPQGIAALLAFNFQSDLDTNVKAMTRAAHNIRTIEITKATRSVKLDSIEVKEGQFIGLIDDDLAGASDDRTTITLNMLNQARTEECEIITLYYGDAVNANEAEELSEAIRQKYPSQEIEVVSGGQPHYHFIISVE
ncbi:MAG: DAK2 domain-containing protein, partial [Anaerolineales bacterium]|nr:DAK2 domain-containing protein [Anaerolineales bacterium]